MEAEEETSHRTELMFVFCPVISEGKGKNMANIFLTDSNEEVIGNFIKAHEKLYKIHKLFQNKGRKDYL